MWSVENDETSEMVLLAMVTFIIIFTLELIMTAIVLAKIFENATNAVLCAINIWIFNYAVFGVILRRYWEEHGHYVFVILLSFFNNQIPYSMQMFNRLIEEPRDVLAYDIAALYVSALSSALIFIIILILLQWRMPGRLLSRRIIYSTRRRKFVLDSNLIHLGRSPSWHNFEFGDVGSSEWIRLKHVYTSHSLSERKILKNISMRIYKGEVYVLLGHIGSGKLTLLRVLCGLKYPVRGTVYYEGQDIYEDLPRIRKKFDFRSIENGLADHLSIEQTINYHARLKLGKESLDRYDLERNKWIDLLETYVESRGTRIWQLTNGERRLVSLCCALAGDTKVIVFEEPTRELTAREAQIFGVLLQWRRRVEPLLYPPLASMRPKLLPIALEL